MTRNESAGQSGDKTLTFALCTRDFSRVFDLVKILTERGMKYVLLAPGERIDRRVDAAIVEGPSPLFTAGKPPSLRPLRDPGMTVDRAVASALGVFKPARMVLGIDPGLRIGLAVLADGILINSTITTDPRSIPGRFKASVRSLRPRSSLIRIGDGDPYNRDGIISILTACRKIIEIVDERSTSIETVETHRDSAIRIARMRGRPLDLESSQDQQEKKYHKQAEDNTLSQTGCELG